MLYRASLCERKKNDVVCILCSIAPAVVNAKTDFVYILCSIAPVAVNAQADFVCILCSIVPAVVNAKTDFVCTCPRSGTIHLDVYSAPPPGAGAGGTT